jgi:diguanylate cyclase (GGDEF)-like protein/PAS domain S-box-containing protein
MTGEKILVVEDEAIIAYNLQRILSSFGYKVPETVESGPQAIKAAETLQPDLVLMDIQLRGEMDGIEAARQIRARSDLPVVYLTAYAEDTRLMQARQTTPYGYLVKPVQDRELHATIEMALYKHQFDLKLKESEMAYRELYHNTPAMLHTVNHQGIILQVSDFWLTALGYSREEVIGHDLIEFIAPTSRKYITEVVNPEFARTGVACDIDCEFLRKDGEVIHTLYSTVGVMDRTGKLHHAHAALVDISSRKQVERAERDQRNLAEALRDTASALSSTLSFDEVIERVLTNVGKVVPYDAVNIMLVEQGYAHVVREHGYKDLGKENDVASLRLKIDEVPHLRQMAEMRQPVTFPNTALVKGWDPDFIRSYAGAPIIAKGQLAGFINLVGVSSNFYHQEHAIRLQAFADQAAIAIENARLYAEVERLATLDEVTGILNRRRLFQLGRREMELSRRYGTSLAAILLDIDLFKKINDTYGHTAGDRVLSGIASTISHNIREIDLFGRYGGEEFVILLPSTGAEAAREVAERVRELVAGLRFDTERGPLEVTISLGVAMLTSDVPSLATLIDRADQAMYSAKQAGRNRVEVYE